MSFPPVVQWSRTLKFSRKAFECLEGPVRSSTTFTWRMYPIPGAGALGRFARAIQASTV